MERFILQDLNQWKNRKYRKPLIIKGVRQTGKTYILKKFGKDYFPECHYINFEQHPKAANLFSGDFDVKRILSDLSFLLGHSIDKKNDLLIFDEIQACPSALSSLKYFAILKYDYGTYKGYFAENFMAQEFIAKEIVNLYSWQENRAEIEFLYVLKNQVMPIEVKSGWVTRRQSLNKYAEKYLPPYRTTFSAKPLHIDLKNHYHHYPLYMAYWFPLAQKF